MPALALRPVAVRFTEPGMEDAHFDLVYERADGERQWEQLHAATVAELKAELCRMHPSMAGRRLRLIFLGRVVPNSVHLAPWLDEMAPSEAGALECMTVERVERAERAGRDGTYTLRRHTPSKAEGKQRLLDAHDDGMPVVTDVDVVVLPMVFLQCSIGSAGARGADDDDDAPAPSTSQARGFDRLRHTAGMSDTDIQAMREQFHRQSGMLGFRSGDVLRQREEEDYAYTMEEQWIDSMGHDPIRRDVPNAWASAVAGLLMGFLFPFVPLFFVYEPKVLRWSRRRRRSDVLERTRELEALLEQASQPDALPQARLDEVRASLASFVTQLRHDEARRREQSGSDSESGSDAPTAAPGRSPLERLRQRMPDTNRQVRARY